MLGLFSLTTFLAGAFFTTARSGSFRSNAAGREPAAGRGGVEGRETAVLRLTVAAFRLTFCPDTVFADDLEVFGVVLVTLLEADSVLRACASAAGSKATDAEITSTAASAVLIFLIIVQF